MEKDDGGELGGGKAREGGDGNRKGDREITEVVAVGQCQKGDAGRRLDGDLEMDRLEAKALDKKIPEVTDTANVDVQEMKRNDTPEESAVDTNHGMSLLELDARKKMKVAAEPPPSSPGGTAGDDMTAAAVSAPINPLLMVDILEVVFKHILAQPSPADVAGDVQNIRLVSKSWRDAVTPLYRRKLPPIKIDLVNNWRVYGSIIKAPSAIERFLETIRSSTMPPVESYAITCNLFLVSHQELLIKFLRICGPKAVSLSLQLEKAVGGVESHENYNSWNDLSDLNLPQLKALMLANSINASSPTLANLLKVVLDATKQLHEFQIPCSFYMPDLDSGKTDNCEILNVICTRLPATVKSLNIYQSLFSNCLQPLQQLARNGIKLTKFEFVRIAHKAVDKPMFSNFLESQAGTLKSLTIFGKIQPTESIFWEFPRLEKLLKWTAVHIIPGPLSFAETFPKLEELDLRDWSKEAVLLELFASVEKDKKKSAPSVRKMCLPFYLDDEMSAPFLKRLSNCFPNISQLHIRSSESTNESIPLIFTYFTNVEQLEIEFYADDGPGSNDYADADAVLSGLPRSQCKQLRRRLRNLDDVGLLLEGIEQRPSILNLTKLRKLVLKEEEEEGFRDFPIPIFLSDFSAHFLFLRMACLKELSVQLFGCKISRQCKELLEHRVRLTLAGNDENGWEDDDDETSTDSSIVSESEDDFAEDEDGVGLDIERDDEENSEEGAHDEEESDPAPEDPEGGN